MISSSPNLLYTHNLFPFPAKFPPEPIRDLILEYSKKGEYVLDPFCGSGTALVEALIHDRNAYGIDVNPVAALVSNAKATVYQVEDIDQLDNILNILMVLSVRRDSAIQSNLNSSDIPDYKNIDHWFKRNMLDELALLRKMFLDKPETGERLNNLLWMAFLKIIVPVSNQDGETRYAAIDKPEIVDGYAIQKFGEVLQEYRRVLEDAKELRANSATALASEGDTLSLIQNFHNESIDFVVTSPPYINTFDYYLYHKHRIFWMGRDPRQIRHKEVGCHHRIDSMTYVEALNEYQSYLEAVFRQINLKLKKDKRFAILIGDGIVKDQVVKADELVSYLAESTGFVVERAEAINLREVSRGFIKTRSLDRKQHHSIILRK